MMLSLTLLPNNFSPSSDSFLDPSTWNLIFQALWSYLPESILEYVRYVPTREYTRFRKTLKVINKVSQQLIDHKSRIMSEDKSARDIMSVLGKAIRARSFITR